MAYLVFAGFTRRLTNCCIVINEWKSFLCFFVLWLIIVSFVGEFHQFSKNELQMAYIEHKGPFTFCINEKVSKQRNLSEAMGRCLPCIFIICSVLALLATGTGAIDIFLEWNVSFDWNIRPVFTHQPVRIFYSTVTVVSLLIYLE